MDHCKGHITGANVHDFPRVKLTQEGKRLRKIEEEEAMARGDTINKEKPMADIRLTAAIQCEPDGKTPTFSLSLEFNTTLSS